MCFTHISGYDPQSATTPDKSYSSTSYGRGVYYSHHLFYGFLKGFYSNYPRLPK